MRNTIKTSGKATIIGLLTTVVWASGCMTPAGTKTTEGVTVPTHYNGSTDTAFSLPDWQNYFADKWLKQLVDDALHKNYDVLAATQRVEAARSMLLGARAPLAPNLGINTFASNIKYGRYTMDGAGNATTPEVPSPIVPSYMLGVSAGWEADMWGKLKNRKKAAQMRFLSTGMGKHLIETTVMAEVSNAYYDLIAADEELKIVRRNVQLQETALDMVRHQKDAGRANELAVKQFSAQLLHTRAMEYAALQRIKATEKHLLTLTGSWADDVARDSTIFGPISHRVVKQGVPARLLANRPDIMRAEMDLKATGAEVAAARAAFLPSLTISTNVGYNTFHPELMFDPVSATAGLLGTLAGPLLNRRTVKAAYGQAQAENKEAWYRYGQQVLTACNEVKVRLNDIDNLEKEYVLQEQSTTELKEAITISKDLYRAGYANYLEVVTAQKNALDAELKLVDTRKRLHLAHINLYRALGGGWTRDGQ